MKVIIYTTSTCPRCKILKDKLSAKNIDFEECQDIEEMEKLDICDVPQLMIGGELHNFGQAIAWINSL